MWRQLRLAWRFLMDLDAEPYQRPELIMAGPEADAEPQVHTVETATPGRCDGCGATPLVVWELDASEFRFCAHHSRQHATVLYGLGYRSKRLARM